MENTNLHSPIGDCAFFQYFKCSNVSSSRYKSLTPDIDFVSVRYSLKKEQFSDLVQYRKNYENYYGKEVER